jgi:hypothetical protein
MKLRIVSASDLTAAGVDLTLSPLVESWHSTGSWPQLLGRSYHVLAVPAASLKPGDIAKVCAFLKTTPDRIVVLDVEGEGELDPSEDARTAVYARSIFRAGEVARFRIVALPPLAADLGARTDAERSYEKDISFCEVLTNSAEFATYRVLQATPTRPAMPGYSVATQERPPLLTDLRSCNELTKPDVIFGQRRWRPGKGEVDPAELRASLIRSRSAVAVQRFTGGSIPRRVVEAASVGTLVFLIGHAPKTPLGTYCSNWLHQIPMEDLERADVIIKDKLLALGDDGVREASRASRAWFESIRPAAWPQRLAGALT